MMRRERRKQEVKGLLIMINSKVVLGLLSLFLTFCLGCAYFSNSSSTSPVNETELSDSFLYEHKAKIEYADLVKSQIDKEAKEGCIRTAHSFLMTDKYKQDFMNYRHKNPKEHRLNKMFDFVIYCNIAVRNLPSRGKENVLELLVKYYYGNEYCEETILSKLAIKSIVTQLRLGAYCEPSKRSDLDRVIVESITPKTVKEDGIRVRVRFMEGTTTMLWVFDFRQYELNGKRVWIPWDFWNGGYVD
jgi:hypothetical protein